MSRYGRVDDAGDALVDAWGTTKVSGDVANGAVMEAGDGSSGGSGGDGAGSGAAAGAFGTMLFRLILVAGIVLGCVLAGMAVHNDHKLEHKLKNDVAPALEYAYNFSLAGAESSQTYCSESFVHVAAGTPPTGTLFLFKREVAAPPADNAEAYLDSLGRREVAPRAEHATRGFPLVNTRLPGTSGMVSILRVGETVRIKFTASGLPTNLSAAVPYWEDPDTALRISSYIPYECVPPVAAWPNCNASLPNVAPCTDVVLDDVYHPVRTFPGHDTIGAVHHTHAVNGLGWFAGNHIILSASITANGFDGETYVVGTQTDMISVVDSMFDALMFADLRAEAVYKTDAPIDWAVPEFCRAECVF